MAIAAEGLIGPRHVRLCAQCNLCSAAEACCPAGKVQILQRSKTMPNNYRAWLRDGDGRFLLSMLWPTDGDRIARQDENLGWCPNLPLSECPPDYMLRNWL